MRGNYSRYGKLFTLRNVHVKAQLFWFEYGDSFVIRPYKDEKVILESPFSPVEDIPPGQARCTRPLATFPENFWSKFTPDQ